MSSPIFRPIRESDREAWSPLWAGYLVFYQETLESSQTELTWSRFFEESFNLHGFVVEVNGEVVGFAHCSFTNSTWLEKPDLYLEDLFVSTQHRRQGLGEFLIENCAKFAKESGSRRLYWQTQRSNESAQRLYNKIANLSEYIIFEKVLND
jgi:ribosomal protein S18 acetylase RimI-like enzyme